MIYRYFFIWVFLISIPLNCLGQQALVLSGSDSSMDKFVFKELLKPAYKNISIDVSMLAMPSKRSLVNSNSHVTAGEIARITNINEKFPNLVRIPVPIMVSGIYALGLQPMSITSWQGLQPYNIAYRRGIQLIKNNLIKYGLKSSVVNKDDELIQFLLRKRSDLIIQDKSLAIASIKKIKKAGVKTSSIKFIEPPLIEVPLYHFLHKSEQALLPRITKQLRHMEKEGVIKQKIALYFKTLMQN